MMVLFGPIGIQNTTDNEKKTSSVSITKSGQMQRTDYARNANKSFGPNFQMKKAECSRGARKFRFGGKDAL